MNDIKYCIILVSILSLVIFLFFIIDISITTDMEKCITYWEHHTNITNTNKFYEINNGKCIERYPAGGVWYSKAEETMKNVNKWINNSNPDICNFKCYFNPD